jgi:hypothetical protein
MASVVSVVAAGAGGNGTASGDQDGYISRSYRTTHKVTTTDIYAASYIFEHFMFNVECPWPGRTYNYAGGFDVTSVCRTVDVKYVENSGGTQWIVDSTFAPEQGQAEEKPDAQGNNTTNPLFWRDEIDVSYSQFTIPVEAAEFRAFVPNFINNQFFPFGYKGAVVNSAIKPYDPTLEEEAQLKIIRITKHGPVYQGGNFDAYQGAINGDTVTINKPLYRFFQVIPPFRGLIKGLSATFAISNNIPHWRQTMELHISPLLFGWFRPLIDRGLDARRAQGDPNGRGGTVSASEVSAFGAVHHEPIKDRDGVPVTEPVLLDGNGQPLKPGLSPVIMVWNTRKIMPFSPIRW